MEIGELKPFRLGHECITIGLQYEKGRSDRILLDLVCLLFNKEAQLIASGYHNKPCESPCIRARHTGTLGFEYEFLINLKDIPDTIHSIVIMVRNPGDSVDCIRRDFTIQCSVVKNLGLANYASNIICTYFSQQNIIQQNEYDSDIFTICKLYRDAANPKEWKVHLIWQGDVAKQPNVESLMEIAHIYMVDIYPDLLKSQINFLATTEDICGAIQRDDFPILKPFFNDGGLTKENFARILLRQLLLTRPFLREETKASDITKLLYDLFEQIDINEDLKVDWEEFTSFCIMIGMISTRQQRIAKPTDLVHEAYFQQKLDNKKIYDSNTIKCLRYFPELEKIAVVQHLSPKVSLFGTDGKYLHDFNAIDKSLDSGDTGVTDIACIIFKRLTNFAIACTSQYIGLWNIVNAIRGVYVLTTRLATRETQLSVKWSSVLNTMISYSAGKVLLVWSLDQERSTNLTGHKDYISDFIDIPDFNCFATCSLDRRILVRDAKSHDVLYTMRGHKKGIRSLDYARHILLSCGFEHHAYCWYIPNTKHSMVLGGHCDSLIGAKMLTADPHILRCVTGDVTGKFKIWDISRCSKSAKSIAIQLQVFQYERHTDSITIHQLISSFCIVPEHSSKSISRAFHDIIATDITGLTRFRVEPNLSNLEPPRYVVFNTVCNTFSACVKNIIRVWDARTGLLNQDLVEITNTDVTAMTYAMPLQRKLFIGKENGHLSVYNPVNGQEVTNVADLHSESITALIYCPEVRCVITVGKDRRIAVSHDTPGCDEISPLRTQDNAHENTITCATYCYELSLIATGDATGVLRIWDFESLHLSATCIGHRTEIMHLQFWHPSNILISSDNAGDIFMWKTRSLRRETACLIHLVYRRKETVHSTLPSVNSFCSCTDTENNAFILAADDLGYIAVWKGEDILNNAEARGLGCYFKPLQPAEIISQKTRYNPYSVSKATFCLKTHKAEKKRLFNTVRHEQKRRSSMMSSIKLAHHLDWRGHREGIYDIKSIGSIVFSSSHDQSVRLWETNGTCIGAFFAEEVCARNLKYPIPWLFGNLQKDIGPKEEHKQIAKDVLTHTNWASAVAAVDNDDDSTTQTHTSRRSCNISRQMSRNNLYTPKTTMRRTQLKQLGVKSKGKVVTNNELSPSMKLILKEVEKEKAFTQHSISSGTRDGFFGGQEALALHMLINSASGVDAYNRPTTPLLLPDAALKNHQHMRKHKSVSDMPVVRLCNNFSATIDQQKSASHPTDSSLSIEPSDFLKKHINCQPIYKTRISARSELVRRKKPVRNINRKPYQLRTIPKSSKITLSAEAKQRIRAKVDRKVNLSASLYDNGIQVDADDRRMTKTTVKPPLPSKRHSIPLNMKNPYGPYYSLEEVNEIADIIMEFDNNSSGDIDRSEWAAIISCFETARRDHLETDQLFLRVDKDDDGTVSVSELLKIVFRQATPAQISHMCRTIQARFKKD